MSTAMDYKTAVICDCVSVGYGVNGGYYSNMLRYRTKIKFLKAIEHE
jgi:hypothetical protein